MSFLNHVNKLVSERAFHSSPHDHEKFDLAHIGSGEGLKEYGWGQYFADTPEGIVLYNHYFKDRLRNPTEYEVELQLEMDELLDWDKTYENQSNKVKDILKNAVKYFRKYTYKKFADGGGMVVDPEGTSSSDIIAFNEEQLKDVTHGPMSNFYEYMARWCGSDKKASLGLLSHGIKGIKYKSKRCNNFVIFDDSLIIIKNKRKAFMDEIG